MLKIGQLAQIKSDWPYVYEALTQIVNAVNSVGRAAGVDPSGTIDPPAPIGSLRVTSADGIFDLAITDNSSVHRGIFYFAESDVTPAFSQPRVHFLGSSRNLRVGARPPGLSYSLRQEAALLQAPQADRASAGSRRASQVPSSCGRKKGPSPRRSGPVLKFCFSG